MRKTKIDFGDLIEITDKNYPHFMGKQATIIELFPSSMFIDFRKEIEKDGEVITHTGSGLLDEPTGYTVNRDIKFKIIKRMNGIEKIFFYCNFANKKRLNDDKFELERTLQSIKSDIEYHGKRLLEKEEQFNKKNKEKELLEKTSINLYNLNIAEKIKNHKKIKKMKIIDNFVYVETNKLKDEETGIDLGRFVIQFDLDNNLYFRIKNIEKYLINSGDIIYHPHIENNKICFGTADPIVMDLRNKYDLAGLIFFIIGFLERPNTATPYCNIKIFQAAQKIDGFKPINYRDYFNMNFKEYLYDNFDEDAYEERLQEIE